MTSQAHPPSPPPTTTTRRSFLRVTLATSAALAAGVRCDYGGLLIAILSLIARAVPVLVDEFGEPLAPAVDGARARAAALEVLAAEGCAEIENTSDEDQYVRVTVELHTYDYGLHKSVVFKTADGLDPLIRAGETAKLHFAPMTSDYPGAHYLVVKAGDDEARSELFEL